LRVRWGNSTYDAFGNRLTDYVKTNYGNSQSSAWTYENRVFSDWLIGLRTAQSVTSFSNGTFATRTTVWVYDKQGRLEKVGIEPNGGDDVRQVVKIAYDARGLVTGVLREAPGADQQKVPPRSETFAYDTEGVFVRAVGNALGHWRKIAVHPAFGFTMAAMEENNVLQQFVHDDLGRLITLIPQGGAMQTLSYGPRQLAGIAGLVTSVSRQGGGGGAVEADELGRSVKEYASTFDGQVRVVSRRWDMLGRLRSVSRPGFNAPGAAKTTYRYDTLDRLVEEKAPDGAITTHQHSFFTTETINPEKEQTKLVRDVDGHTIQSISYLSKNQPLVTAFAYGPFDTVTRVTDPLNHATIMGYDVLGRRTSLQDPDSGLTQTRYNGFSDVRQVVSALGQQSDRIYDAIGRVLSSTDVDGTTSFEWDTSPKGVGRIARAVTPDGVEMSYSYDPFARPAGQRWKIGGETFAFDYTYDNLGRLATLIYPEAPGYGRFTVGHSYNQHGYLYEVADVTFGGHVPLWTAGSRSVDDQINTWLTGDGTIGARGYDPLTGRPSFVVAGKPAPNPTIFSQQYAYDNAGRLNSRVDSVLGRSERFSYDPLSRLVGWDLDAKGKAPRKTTFEYDLIGNLLSVDASGSPKETSIYGGPGAPLHAVTIKDGLAYHYDGAGRMTDGGGRAFTWTPFNLPRSVQTAAGKTTFRYDALGKRVQKAGPQEVVMELGGLYERRKSGAAPAIHIFHVTAGRDGMVAQLQWDESGFRARRFLITDPLGSISLVTDHTGSVVQRLHYAPFGGRTNEFGAAIDPPLNDVRDGFAGLSHDDELRLIDMNGRVYDPRLRRFITPDPIVSLPMRSESWNRYSYVVNDPLNRRDPSGWDFSEQGNKNPENWCTDFDCDVQPLDTYCSSAGANCFTEGGEGKKSDGKFLPISGPGSPMDSFEKYTNDPVASDSDGYRDVGSGAKSYNQPSSELPGGGSPKVSERRIVEQTAHRERAFEVERLDRNGIQGPARIDSARPVDPGKPNPMATGDPVTDSKSDVDPPGVSPTPAPIDWASEQARLHQLLYLPPANAQEALNTPINSPYLNYQQESAFRELILLQARLRGYRY
jgi:RHS repeat-associated protein